MSDATPIDSTTPGETFSSQQTHHPGISPDAPSIHPSFLITSSRIKLHHAHSLFNKIRETLKLQINPVEKKFFEQHYETSYEFYYNPHFLKSVNIEYIGQVEIAPTTQSENQTIRLDLVAVKIPSIDILSIHGHILFEDPTKFMPNDGQLHPFFAVLNKTFFNDANENNPIKELKELLTIVETRINTTGDTFPITKYLYFSINNIKSEAFDDLRSMAAPTYAVLHSHMGNVDQNTAANRLEMASWQSTDFFINYYQPGAMVTLAKPFSTEIYEKYNDWFIRRLCRLQDGSSDKRSTSTLGLTSDPTAGVWPEMIRYQFVPEYPPLKYLGFLSLEYSAIFEETMRTLFERLLRLSSHGAFGRLWGLFSGDYYSVSQSLHRFYKIRNFENLKLPVVRGFVIDLINNKRQEYIIEAIASMSANIMTGMQFVIAFIVFLMVILGLVNVETWLCDQKDIFCLFEPKGAHSGDIRSAIPITSGQ